MATGGRAGSRRYTRHCSPPAPTAVSTTLHRSDLPALALLHSGKVRDVFDLPGQRLLMVASDRLSAFDVVLPEGTDVALYAKRSVVVKKLKPVPVEAIARGYIIGSGWKDYQRTGSVCGIALPAGLRQAEQLPEPIFTPSTKAAAGNHDENVSFDAVAAQIGGELAERVREATLAVYRFAVKHAAERGILIADTKLEFGLDEAGVLHVMDEMLTPDSSRFWPADSYSVGTSPPSYDKQFVRDYLETLDWDKTAPGPRVPADVIAATREKYAEALWRLADLRID